MYGPVGYLLCELKMQVLLPTNPYGSIVHNVSLFSQYVCLQSIFTILVPFSHNSNGPTSCMCSPGYFLLEAPIVWLCLCQMAMTYSVLHY